VKKALSIAFILSSLVVSACGSKTDATEGNFKDAISAYLDRNGGCTHFEPLSITDDISLAPHIYAAKLGYLRAESKKPVANGFSWYQWAVTDEGKPHTIEGKARYGFSQTNGFALCFARERLTKIVKWEGPTDSRGHTVAIVTYVSDYEEFQPWAKSEEFQKVYPGEAKLMKIKSTQESKIALVKTNIGWERSEDQPL